MEQLELLVSGQVQGVFFRATMREKAQALGLTGYAENLPDGRVRVVAQGERAGLEQLHQHCYNGVSAAEVETVEAQWKEATEQYAGFTIR